MKKFLHIFFKFFYDYFQNKNNHPAQNIRMSYNTYSVREIGVKIIKLWTYIYYYLRINDQEKRMEFNKRKELLKMNFLVK